MVLAVVIYINLDDDEQAYPSTHLWRISIHASHDIHNSLSNGDDHSKHCKSTSKNVKQAQLKWELLWKCKHQSIKDIFKASKRYMTASENSNCLMSNNNTYISELRWRGLCP